MGADLEALSEGLLHAHAWVLGAGPLHKPDCVTVVPACRAVAFIGGWQIKVRVRLDLVVGAAPAWAPVWGVYATSPAL